MRITGPLYLAHPFAQDIFKGVILVAIFATCVVGRTTAMPIDHSDIVQQLGSDNVHWDPIQSAYLGGVAVRTASFTSSLSVTRVAQKFSNAHDVFERILTMPGHLVLSGLKDGWHWLGIIKTELSGTSGYVSTMATQGTSSIAVHRWLPPHTRAIFSHNEVLDGSLVMQHVYQHAWSQHRFRNYIYAQLVRSGWALLTSSDNAHEPWNWRRDGETLTISTVPAKPGTSVFVQHTTRSLTQ